MTKKIELRSSESSNPQQRTFGRYSVQRLLGEGAMGRVYLAKDPVLDRLVAVKVIAIDKQPDSQTKEEYLNRFALEARASAKLSHPSIVTIFDAGNEHGIPWIAFEYVEGEQLQQLLEQKDLLAIDRVVSITLDMAAALHHAHHRAIIHRDVKPANILIDKLTHIAKLADFGVVKAPWIALTQDGSAVGSPGYMSPEQLDGTGADARSDLFSLGIVMYQMLSGKHPFMRDSIPATIFATLHGQFPKLEEIRPDIPPYLATIVAALLKANPNERIQTADKLLHQLRSGSREGYPLDAHQSIAGTTGNLTRLQRISHTLRSINSDLSRRVAHTPQVQQLLQRFYMSATNTLAALRVHAAAPLQYVRRHKTQLFIAPILLLLVAIPAVLIKQHISLSSYERGILRDLTTNGYQGNPQQLLEECLQLIKAKEFNKAKTLAEKLSKLHTIATQSYLALGTIGLLDNNDDDAARAFSMASGSKEWKIHAGRELKSLIALCKQRLEHDEINTELATSLAHTVFADRAHLIRSWVGEKPYWLRWNSVKIASANNMTIDMGKVYLLDMNHAGSMRTRVRAINKLGELGDKRAIKPLEEIAARGLSDPIMSYAAKAVLENSFRESK